MWPRKLRQNETEWDVLLTLVSICHIVTVDFEKQTKFEATFEANVAEKLGGTQTKGMFLQFFKR